jgi:hypothetical protein
MPYKLELNLPNSASGTDVELDGLGIFANGSVYYLEDEEAKTYADTHGGTTVEDEFGSHAHITVTQVSADEVPKDAEEVDSTQPPVVDQVTNTGGRVKARGPRQLALDDPSATHDEKEDDQ